MRPLILCLFLTGCATDPQQLQAAAAMFQGPPMMPYTGGPVTQAPPPPPPMPGSICGHVFSANGTYRGFVRC